MKWSVDGRGGGEDRGRMEWILGGGRMRGEGSEVDMDEELRGRRGRGDGNGMGRHG